MNRRSLSPGGEQTKTGRDKPEAILTVVKAVAVGRAAPVPDKLRRFSDSPRAGTPTDISVKAIISRNALNFHFAIFILNNFS
jgi:hypothetical protein